MKNKKGFTLIELLAVIIILGILMIIAIPSVTKYISDSRKNSYVDTAKEIISGARNVVNAGKLGMYDTNTTYYIPTSCIKTENATKSPYGDFELAYVVITYDGKGYEYYWISVDDAGQGVKEITSYDELDTDDIKSDIDPKEIKNIVEHTGVGNRKNILILDENGNWSDPYHADNHVGDDGSIVIYPEGKDKNSVVLGDVVIIGNQEFNVLKRDGNDLYLLAKYNLNVGSKAKDNPTGIQDSDVLGWNGYDAPDYGCVVFSDTTYWDSQIGTKYEGSYCNSPDIPNGTSCAYVYDNNSSIYQYVESYKSYLEKKGVTIKNARLLRLEEAVELGCGSSRWSCSAAPSWLYKAGFWLGSARNDSTVWGIDSEGDIYENDYDDYWLFGVRPVIVI